MNEETQPTASDFGIIGLEGHKTVRRTVEREQARIWGPCDGTIIYFGQKYIVSSLAAKSLILGTSYICQSHFFLP